MNLWCDCCDKVQPVEVTDERCAKTYTAYQDIICTKCHLVIASGNDIRHTWVGLTDEEMRALKQKMIEDSMLRIVSDFEYIRFIEAKLKEKNT